MDSKAGGDGKKRKREEEDSDSESGTGSEQSSKKKKSKVYDEETGALTRVYRSFTSKFSIDRGYGKSSELHDHPFLHPQILLIVGPTGCGKTTLMLNILEEILENMDDKCLGDVIVYSGSPKDQLLDMLDPAEVDLCGPEQTQTLLDRLEQMQIEGAETSELMTSKRGRKKKKLHLLILDDVGNNRDLCPNNAKGTTIGRTLQSHRHLPMLVVMLTQKWKMLPTFARANCAHLFVFPGQSEVERKELVNHLPFPKEQIENLMRMTASKKHQFMWFDLVHKTAKMGFDRVLLE
jgi:DNA polymerase III delta prime subunit